MDEQRKRVRILGVDVDAVTMEQALRRTDSFLRNERANVVVTVGPEFVLRAQQDAEYRNALNSAALVLPDGFGLLVASRLLRLPLRHRVAGVDYVQRLLERAAQSGKTVFLFGGERGEARAAEERLHETLPSLKIAGVLPDVPVPYEAATDASHATTQRAIAAINASGARILLVALNAPRQELWLATVAPHLITVRVLVGAGGTFKLLSGRVPRAPRWMRALGIEWVWRVLREPSRLPRTVMAVFLFLFTILFRRTA